MVHVQSNWHSMKCHSLNIRAGHQKPRSLQCTTIIVSSIDNTSVTLVMPTSTNMNMPTEANWYTPVLLGTYCRDGTTLPSGSIKSRDWNSLRTRPAIA